MINKVYHKKMMPERWEAAEHWYKNAGVAAQFVINDEAHHEIKNEMTNGFHLFGGWINLANSLNN